jgi:hypothetical protein
MSSNPANKQMHLLLSKNIFVNHSVVIPSNIKTTLFDLLPIKIGTAIGGLYVSR